MPTRLISSVHVSVTPTVSSLIQNSAFVSFFSTSDFLAFISVKKDYYLLMIQLIVRLLKFKAASSDK